MSTQVLTQTRLYPPQEEESSNDPLGLRRYLVDVSSVPKSTRDFYQAQNKHIETLTSEQEPVKDDNLKLKIALYGSFGANICLFGFQLTAAILSKSLALFATTADSFMDLASSVVMLYTEYLIRRSNHLKYPTGSQKYETAGIIVFSTLMATLSIQLIVTAVQTFISGETEIKFDAISIALVSTALVTKALLFVYCRALSKYPTAAILAQDHSNDIILNSTGIVFGLLAKYYAWWIDPTAAVIIALLIFRSWATTGSEHIRQLVGISADQSFINHLVYISMMHDPRIKQVDTCRAYSSGTNYFVEIDIVLPPDMTLQEAHDIGESLQMKVEDMPNVDRCFVHLDHESDHKPEHKKYK
ncbi:cation efflux family-domain-containing protein [Gorgonomyces haynaldii]|nr:cation efflux family-domain-containing protein [Gorgonomyces haynaldii]